jgi:hypothetical protein
MWITNGGLTAADFHFNTPIWVSGPPVQSNQSYLIVQDDGFMCLYEGSYDDSTSYTGTDDAIWHSTTPIPWDAPVKGIRVHNLSGMVIKFAVNGTGNTSEFPNPDYATVDLTDRTKNGGRVLNGDAICPAVSWRSPSRRLNWYTELAGHNCIYDKDSLVFGVYDFTGSDFNPGFTFQGPSADP